jgi:hypothetical protein
MLSPNSSQTTWYNLRDYRPTGHSSIPTHRFHGAPQLPTRGIPGFLARVQVLDRHSAVQCVRGTASERITSLKLILPEFDSSLMVQVRLLRLTLWPLS